MVNNTDGISGNRPNVTGTGSKSRPESGDAASRAPAENNSATRTDEVSLTSSAQLLKELSEAVNAAPSVNQQRIDAIRQSLADGLYEVDAGSIADKLLSLDEQL